MPEPLPFERTTCACPRCVACCSRQPGALVPGDLERIAAFLGAPSVEPVLALFRASKGALVGRRDGDVVTVARVGTITPGMAGGRCVFLTPEDRCAIHPVAPAGCAYFDMHMGRDVAEPRSLAVVERQADPAYQALRRTLVPADSWRPNAGGDK